MTKIQKALENSNLKLKFTEDFVFGEVLFQTVDHLCLQHLFSLYQQLSMSISK